MNVQVTARRFKAHESLREYAENEVKKLVKFYDGILSSDVILSYEKPKDSVKTAEITLVVFGKKIFAKESSDEFTKSIDNAVEKLERQLKKYKTKKRDRKKSNLKVPL